MTLYSIGIRVYAVAYIKAGSPEEAVRIANSLKDTPFEVDERGGDLPIYGGRLTDPEIPDLSLSPVMTIRGPQENDGPDRVDDDDTGIEDEEDDKPAAESPRDALGNEVAPKYINRYRHCGQEWEDIWDCMCNDKCPVCNAEIEPYESEDNPDYDGCAECGSSLDDGEGYDGLCGTCADKAENAQPEAKG